MEEIYFRPREAAERLRVHLMTIYKWISRGQLKATRLPGGGLRIEAKELDKMLSRNTKAPTKSRRVTGGGTRD